MTRRMRIQITLQAIAVFFLFSLSLFFFVDFNNENKLSLINIIKYTGFCCLFLGIYFLNYYVLFPKLYQQKKYALYVISLLLLMATITLTRPYDLLVARPNFTPRGLNIPHHKDAFIPKEPGVDIISVFGFLLVITIGISGKTNRELHNALHRALKAENEKKQAELSFLKAQVNPHLLFNALNNIYTLATIKDDNTAPAIMRLSKLMRYITDEVQTELVPLDKELNCIQDYIELQKLRLTEKSIVDYEISPIVGHHYIAPLILLSFVENAFKFGVSNHNDNYIHIRITTMASSIIFYCRNSVNTNIAHHGRTGIGLDNSKKRLAFSYPDTHHLSITQHDDSFVVSLRLDQ